MMVSRMTLWLAVAAMAKPAGRAVPPPSRMSPAVGERSEVGAREEYRLGEDLFQYGVHRGSKHAREGLDFSQAMTKDLRLVPWYGFGGVDLDLNSMGDDLVKRIVAAPPHLTPTYYKAFLAGYELGHELNLPRERQIGLLSLDHLLRIGHALDSYATERSPKIPPMTSIASLRRSLVPLMGVRATDFLDPYTNRPYGLNSSLSGKDYADVKAHAPHTLFAYEATRAPDGTRGVLFVNGEAVRVGKQEWERLRKASGIG